jgi:hypothetical protein
MVFRAVLLLSLISLTACGQSVQQALAPDPRLLPSPTTTVVPETASASPSSTASAAPSSPPTTPSPASTSLSSNKYLSELQELTVLSPTAAQQPAGTVVTRREYARWLLAAHNQIYQTTPHQQLKLATTDTPPVFTDVPTTHPDFIAVQSLANAGIIPSSLSGSTTASSFQPDLALTREQLIFWKVPLDRRQDLPNASVGAVQKNWGFQDAAKISASVLPAVLADYQNGDKSNIRRAFGYTTLFQPQKPATFAEVVAVIWYFGSGDGRSAADALHVLTSSSTPSVSP